MGYGEQSEIDQGANIETVYAIKVDNRLRIENGGDLRKAGIVHEHIQATETVNRLIDDSLTVYFDGHIGDYLKGLRERKKGGQF